MRHILLLGPGLSHRRLFTPDGEPEFGHDPEEALHVVDHSIRVIEHWRAIADTCRMELRKEPLLPFFSSYFAEIHAYEVLNLLAGNEAEFFALWRELWRVLEDGGHIYATVPHWDSTWIHAYPAPQRVYTPALLAYLDPQVGLSSREAFDELWPVPHRFVLEQSFATCKEQDGQRVPMGYRFVLRKERG